MKPKKNPKADLNKNSSLYFVIGLCVILMIFQKIVKTDADLFVRFGIASPIRPCRRWRRLIQTAHVPI